MAEAAGLMPATVSTHTGPNGKQGGYAEFKASPHVHRRVSTFSGVNNFASDSQASAAPSYKG